MLLRVALLCSLVAAAAVADECPRPCRPQDCVQPHNCRAGTVLDACGCCLECGKLEGQKCVHLSVPGSAGQCGDNMDCKLRDDVDGLEAVCTCRMQDELCGTNNETFANFCQLSQAVSRHGTKIRVARRGACPIAPHILNPPEDSKAGRGSNTQFSCEARGTPIPAIEWTWRRVDGKTVYLPSDDLRVSTNMRGGPEKNYITGWVQVMDVAKEHEGDYTCIVQNKHGMRKATARLNVHDQHDEWKTPNEVDPSPKRQPIKYPRT